MKRVFAIVLIFCMLMTGAEVNVWADEKTKVDLQWQEETTMPNGKYCNAAVVVDDDIYLIPGDRNTTNRTINIYNIKTKKWRVGSKLIQNGVGMSACIADGKIYVLGGLAGPGYGMSNALNTL